MATENTCFPIVWQVLAKTKRMVTPNIVVVNSLTSVLNSHTKCIELLVTMATVLSTVATYQLSTLIGETYLTMG